MASGADLAGLVRTEFLFLGRAQAPDVDEQEKAYRGLAEALGGRRLTLRTLDVGGDKPLDYVAMPPEANPFLGVRGLRLSLARPALLADQLLAIVRTAHATPVSLMFPMVSTVAELVEARRMLDAAIAAEGQGEPAGLQVGIMVEVPATALKTAAFAPYVDFFSIGTNDLTQYALAAERGNHAVAALGDPYDPGVLGSWRASATARAGALVAVCGELAADERAAALLVGLGVRELSVAPGGGPVRQAGGARRVERRRASRRAARARPPTGRTACALSSPGRTEPRTATDRHPGLGFVVDGPLAWGPRSERTPAVARYVYDFTEGDKDQKDLLGGKGANLAEMTRLGLPVPPGFTITTEACRHYLERGRGAGRAAGAGDHGAAAPRGRDRAAARCGRRPAAGERAVGGEVLHARDDGDRPQRRAQRLLGPRAGRGLRRRALRLGLLPPPDPDVRQDRARHRRRRASRSALDAAKRRKGVTSDVELDARRPAGARRRRTRRSSCDDTGREFPQDPREQLDLAIRAVFDSWNTERARLYRRRERIPHDLGTAVNVCTMVFGNLGADLGHRRLLHPRPGDGQVGRLRRLPARTRRARTSSRASATPCRWTTSPSSTRRRTPSCARSCGGWRRTTATCATSSSPSSAASCGCCRPASASAPRRRRSGSPPSSSTSS